MYSGKKTLSLGECFVLREKENLIPGLGSGEGVVQLLAKRELEQDVCVDLLFKLPPCASQSREDGVELPCGQGDKQLDGLLLQLRKAFVADVLRTLPLADLIEEIR